MFFYWMGGCCNALSLSEAHRVTGKLSIVNATLWPADSQIHVSSRSKNRYRLGASVVRAVPSGTAISSSTVPARCSCEKRKHSFHL